MIAKCTGDQRSETFRISDSHRVIIGLTLRRGIFTLLRMIFEARSRVWQLKVLASAEHVTSTVTDLKPLLPVAAGDMR
jgi:hypothetical protein